jgi:hypothetical protein
LCLAHGPLLILKEKLHKTKSRAVNEMIYRHYDKNFLSKTSCVKRLRLSPEISYVENRKT